jgi:hypothetical protein
MADAIVRHWIGGDPRVEPAGLTFLVIVIKIYTYMDWNFTKFGALFRFVGVFLLATIFGGPPFLFFKFGFRLSLGIFPHPRGNP